MKKKVDDKCFVCDQPSQNQFGFVGANICSVDCKEIYFKTDNKKIIEQRKIKKSQIHGRK